MDKLKTSSETAGGALVAEVKDRGIVLGSFIGLLWVIQILNTFLFGGWLTQLGIHPRTLAGLWGILFAPFLHGGFAHLIANTVPLAVLGWFVMLREKRDFFRVSIISALVGGLGIWLIAPAATVHIGASILIFGYLGYLLSRGVFEKRFWPIVGSLVVFFLYGGALTGMLPGTFGISWQGHLFGFLGGILAARAMKSPLPAAPEVQPTLRRIALPKTVKEAHVTLAPHEEEEIEEELARMRATVEAQRQR